MSSKLSLLSHAAVVAGILALGLPAFAQTSQPATPSASPTVSPAPVTDKGALKQTPVDHKTAKDKSHAAKKPLVKTAKNSTAHKTATPAAPVTKTEQPVKTDAGK
jgi:hypothetical protein